MRMGLHVTNAGRDELVKQYVRTVQPDAMKFMGAAFSHDLFTYCREHDVRTIGRVYLEDQPLGSRGWRTLHEKVLPKVREFGGIEYIEMYNEVHQDGEDFKRHGELAIDFMKAVEDLGRRAIVFNTSVGDVDEADWHLVEETLDYAARNGHLIGLHEYSRPVMQIGVGSNQRQPDGSWYSQDPCDNWGLEEGWATLRYVKYLRAWRDMGVTIPGIAITESGLDDLRDWVASGKGWRDHVKHPWVQTHGNFAQQEVWYCRHATMHPEVKFVVDFGFGSNEPEKWGSFDLESDLVMLGQFLELMPQLPRGHLAVGGPVMPPIIPQLPTDEYTAHIVEPKDTLWGLAARYLGDGRRWPEIQRAVPMGEPRNLAIGATIFIPEE